jgi:hypothetical protein
MPLDMLVPTRLVTVEVHDIAQNTLVTSYDGPPPPPPLSAQDMAWVESCVRSWRQGW